MLRFPARRFASSPQLAPYLFHLAESDPTPYAPRIVDVARLRTDRERRQLDAVRRGADAGLVDAVLAAAKERADAAAGVASLRKERNALAKERQNAAHLKPLIADASKRLADAELELLTVALRLPNETLEGSSGPEDVVVAQWEPPQEEEEEERPAAVNHLDVLRETGWADFAAGAAVSGSRFLYLRGDLALLELALTRYALDQAVEHLGCEPVAVPDAVREFAAVGCGFAPRSPAGQVYRLAGDPSLCLVGTAEIPLMAMHADSILDGDALPVRLAAVSHCYRAEAGSAGRADAGLYRLHQFAKTELVSVCRPEDAAAELDACVSLQRRLLESLALPYRVLDMSWPELGAPARRKFDCEARMPSRPGDGWGEVTSASDCGDYQTRRLNLRAKGSTGGGAFFPFSVNATALAAPRVMLALIENFWDPQRKVLPLPECLWPYVGGRRELKGRL